MNVQSSIASNNQKVIATQMCTTVYLYDGIVNSSEKAHLPQHRRTPET